MSDPKADVMIVGRHEFRFDPLRRATFVLFQEFDEEHAIAYKEFVAEHVTRFNGPLDAVFDLSALTEVTAAARARIVKGDRDLPYGRVAMVGARFSIRVMANMVIRAGKIVRPEKFSFAFTFVDSIEEANAWLDDDVGAGSGL